MTKGKKSGIRRYYQGVGYSPAEIKALRMRHGLTMWVFAELLGVQRQSVVYWEAGTKTPNNPTLILLRLLDLYPEFFFEPDTKP